jgi:ABC-2 type transport system permease protein
MRWGAAGLLLGAKARVALRGGRGDRVALRLVVLGTVGLLAWSLLFALVYRLLLYFRAAPGIGELLATKLLALILLALLSVLLLSNVVTALSSFFLARDLELLAAAPVEAERFYRARLLETLAHSSWMVVLVLVPVLAAYGWVYGGGWLYAGVAVAAGAALLVLPAVVGTAVTLALVCTFPARRARDLLALIALFGAAGLVVLLRLLRPEQLARPEGFRNLVEFIALLETPRSRWLPSDWAAEALLAPLVAPGAPDLFPLLLLASTAAAFVVLGAWLHGRAYRLGLSRAQEGEEFRAQRRGRPLLERSATARLGAVTGALVAKDVRTFFRDTSQWSQLILLGVLVVMYVYNIKVLPLRTGEAVGDLLIHVVSFLNLGLAGFVLAAVAARFLFPAFSLEGRTLWLLRSSPLELRRLVWSKFWVGLIPLLALALALTAATNWILQVDRFMMGLSLVTIAGMTCALAALALGFGALFPRFDAENPAQIPTGFGGLLFMLTAVAYLAGVVVLEAGPVYQVLTARAAGVPLEAGQWRLLVAGLGGAALLTAVATVVPLRLALRRLADQDALGA